MKQKNIKKLIIHTVFILENLMKIKMNGQINLKNDKF